MGNSKSTNENKKEKKLTKVKKGKKDNTKEE